MNMDLTSERLQSLLEAVKLHQKKLQEKNSQLLLQALRDGLQPFVSLLNDVSMAGLPSGTDIVSLEHEVQQLVQLAEDLAGPDASAVPAEQVLETMETGVAHFIQLVEKLSTPVSDEESKNLMYALKEGMLPFVALLDDLSSAGATSTLSAHDVAEAMEEGVKHLHQLAEDLAGPDTPPTTLSDIIKTVDELTQTVQTLNVGIEQALASLEATISEYTDKMASYGEPVYTALVFKN